LKIYTSPAPHKESGMFHSNRPGEQAVNAETAENQRNTWVQRLVTTVSALPSVVEQHHIQTGTGTHDRCSRSRGPASDNDDIARIHGSRSKSLWAEHFPCAAVHFDEHDAVVTYHDPPLLDFDLGNAEVRGRHSGLTHHRKHSPVQDFGRRHLGPQFAHGGLQIRVGTLDCLEGEYAEVASRGHSSTHGMIS
jgi:hypothetical protein